MPVDIADITQIVEAQKLWRGQQTINLIASENAQSPAVRDIQNSDFMARYAEGHPNQGDQVKRYYQGTPYIDQIETMARQELLELARCRQALHYATALARQSQAQLWVLHVIDTRVTSL